MLFNSLGFLVFFPVVTVTYYAIPDRFRWMLLLAASCVFYMFFIPAYILILLVTIVIDYLAAIWIEKSEGCTRKRALLVSIFATCAVLFVFKYFAFFNGTAHALARAINWNYPVKDLGLILPIGLSFHTFQSLSYVIEVYKERQKAERHFGIYALYVMFYPQLVAGPIERPQNLLHQFRENKRFSYEGVSHGLKMMAWGMFMKVVIADRLAVYVTPAFANPHGYDAVSLSLAVFFFAIQIYCDFSGYSNIALGAARVMGFDLMRNFRQPYFAASVPEFWTRWHISLSTWFRDYVYIPLGGNRVPAPRLFSNLMVVFLVSGLWHGANWTYVIWGALHGCYMIAWGAARLLKPKVPWLTRWQPPRPLGVLVTFMLVCFAWIFFRANSLGDAFHISTKVLTHLVPDTLYRIQAHHFEFGLGTGVGVAFFWIAVLLAIEALHQRWSLPRLLAAQPRAVRMCAYYVLIYAIVFMGEFGSHPFIYFQF